MHNQYYQLKTFNSAVCSNPYYSCTTQLVDFCDSLTLSFNNNIRFKQQYFIKFKFEDVQYVLLPATKNVRVKDPSPRGGICGCSVFSALD